MSRTNAKASDVFLAYAKADAELTAGVVQSFEAAGISVFHLAGLGTNAEQADEVRRRLQECLAFVAILTPYLVRESALAIEIGAAWAGSMPIYLLLSELHQAEIPAYLRRYPAKPLGSGLDSVIEEIRKLTEPLSKQERDILFWAYGEVGLPVDRLIANQADSGRMAELFAEKTDRTLQPGRLVRELLRIRKFGKLPTLAHKTAG